MRGRLAELSQPGFSGQANSDSSFVPIHKATIVEGAMSASLRAADTFQVKAGERRNVCRALGRDETLCYALGGDFHVRHEIF